ncbi:hypothetical protein PFISCL1PPCAC_12775, partial [Pristionchus fissidentatus]
GPTHCSSRFPLQDIMHDVGRVTRHRKKSRRSIENGNSRMNRLRVRLSATARYDQEGEGEEKFEKGDKRRFSSSAIECASPQRSAVNEKGREEKGERECERRHLSHLFARTTFRSE